MIHAQSSATVFLATSVAWPNRSSHCRPVVQCGTRSSRPRAALTISITRDAPRSETPAVNTNCKNKQTIPGPYPWLAMGRSSHSRWIGFVEIARSVFF